MAKNFGARKNSKYKVLSTSPSVNKTPRGDSTPSIPYDVQQDLSGASDTSSNVFFNGDPVYLKTSHSTKVTGDAQGSAGGVKSGTVEGQSDPIEASPSVFVNGKAVVRVGDVQYMQSKNTVGKVVNSESGSASHITDEGEIVAPQSEPIPMPYAKNKPTNNAGSGSLGSRTGSPVLLSSGKLFYSSTDTALIAPIPIATQRLYVSDQRMGMFGRGWESIYDQRLKRINHNTITLSFSDDRTFCFTHSDKEFIDTDDLGASLTALEEQTYKIVYYSDARTELYSNGYLVEISDTNANTLKLVRNTQGKLLHISSGDASLSFEYHYEGYVSHMRDHTHRVWNYTYDTHHNLRSVTDPLGGVERYDYHRDADDAPYRLSRIDDASGVAILEVTYTPEGKVASYREDAQSFSYRYEGNRVIRTEKVNGEAGDTTFYGIDNWGAIRAITYPDGSTTKEIYENNTATIIDEGGNKHTRTFDERHRLLSYLYPNLDRREVHYSYEGDNPYPSIVTDGFKVTTHTYDERYNKLSTTTPEELSESWSYDDRGNVIAHTDSSGIATSFAYNDKGQQLRISDAMGGITQYVYDELGNTTSIIDPNEKITRYEYDTLSRPITLSHNDNNTIHFYYDNAGRFSAISDPAGNMTRYAYDSDGFLARMITPTDGLRTFEHERGKLTSITREDGEEHRFEYDKRGQLISKSSRDKTIRTTYDTLGNLTQASDGNNSVEYVYDTNAQICLERQGDKSVSYAYEYDGSKRFIGYEGMHYRLMRDKSNNITAIRRGVESYQFTYDKASHQTSLTYPNRIESKSIFDLLGRLTTRTLGDQSFLTYQYDKTSRITHKNTLPLTYDSAYQIIQAGDEKYTYDDTGNLIQENSVIDPITQRLMRQGDTSYTYDLLGRLSEKTSPEVKTLYTYDSEGYLVGYDRHSREGGQSALRVNPALILELRFTYDPLGRRLTKHYTSEKETYHRRYLYAGADIVAIYDNDTNELLATLLHDEGFDSPLSISIHPREPLTLEEQHRYEQMDETEQYLFNHSRIQTYYYHRDHQNSIVALSDKNAQIVEVYEYDAFGNITKSETMKDSDGEPIQTLNPYRYTGREYDTSDLYYYRARYYDPTIGRFITPDPIGFLGGDTNFYRYVGNDPVNFVDPSGLQNMATALASAVQNRLNTSLYDGNPFNGIPPDTSVPQPKIPNSTIPTAKTSTVQPNKTKTADVKPKTAQTNKGDGVKVRGNVTKAVDEKCKDQKWHDPINNPQLARYSQNGHDKPYWNVFGYVRDGAKHQGVDLFATPESKVFACVHGTVVRNEFTSSLYGRVITIKAKCPDFVRSLKKPYTLKYPDKGEIEHGANFNESGNFYFFYAHLIESYVNVGDEVKAGKVIGKTGTSGFGTTKDPHLHFEILNVSQTDGMHNRVNPAFYVDFKFPENLSASEQQSQARTKDGLPNHSVWGDPSHTK